MQYAYQLSHCNFKPGRLPQVQQNILFGTLGQKPIVPVQLISSCFNAIPAMPIFVNGASELLEGQGGSVPDSRRQLQRQGNKLVHIDL